MSVDHTLLPPSCSPDLARALADYQPTGEFIGSGQPVWRSFRSKQEWIDKAPTWMRPGDVCFDADGVQLRIGRDFNSARYPVTIARPTRRAAP